MRTQRRRGWRSISGLGFVVALLVALLGGLTGSVAGVAAARGSATAATGSGALGATGTPVLVAVRAAHHPGYDRVVFEFSGAIPSLRRIGYVTKLIEDASGRTVPVAGRAILRLVFQGANAHTPSGRPTVPSRTAYDLPNVITTVKAGDFEAYVTYGIGLAKRTSYQVTRLSRPSRIVIDIKTNFPTVTRKVYFTDSRKIVKNVNPPVTAVYRRVLSTAPATGVMDRLYAGPTPAEKARGLSFTSSRSTGFTKLRIDDRVARVQLTGGCSSGGSAVATVATDIFPTLKQFSTVRWVKIYDPRGRTEYPSGHRDSIPECLEP